MQTVGRSSPVLSYLLTAHYSLLTGARNRERTVRLPRPRVGGRRLARRDDFDLVFFRGGPSFALFCKGWVTPGGNEIQSQHGSNRLLVVQATSKALGFFRAMARSLRAACRGRRVPCSQLRTALGLTFR